MNQIVGTCSICTGPVTVPKAWFGPSRPVPACESCGATARSPHGPVIDMQMTPRSPMQRAWSDMSEEQRRTALNMGAQHA
jgi:hypothetical protein